MKDRTNDIKKTVLYGAFALLLALTYLISMTSCGSASKDEMSMNSSLSYMPESADGTFSYNGFDSAAEDVYYDYDYIEEEKRTETSIQSESGASSVPQNDLSSRKLIKTANLTVETKNFDEFIAELEANITALGGYLSSTSINGSSYDYNRVRYANLTVRIPADTYDAFVSGVSGYGNVTYQSESVDDVTMAYVDTESRIKAYETEYATLLEILEKAETLTDVLTIQNRITEVTYQLESYRSQLRKYDDLISYCTVYINVDEVVELTEIKEPPATLGQRMIRGLKDTWADITDDAEDFAVWFVSSLPLLVIYAAVIIVAVLVLKKVWKKHKIRKKDSTHSNDENSKNSD